MVRVELSILLVCVFVVVVGAYRPYCPCYAEPGYQCPPAPQGCELTKDECGCCDVCAGVRGEPCGTGLPSPSRRPASRVTGKTGHRIPLVYLHWNTANIHVFGERPFARDLLRFVFALQVSGVTIQEGEFVDVTPCQHCGCFNGQPICAVVDCFWSPSCAQWAYPADQCCPVCVQDGHPWVAPVASKRETPARACVVDGVTIEEGEYQQTDEYGCTECGCTGGQPLCWSMACALDINCAEWERVPGRCCPVCTAYHQHHVDIPMVSKRSSSLSRTCEVQGVTIAEGEFKPVDQYGCTTCGCTNGQSFCMAIGCALPTDCLQTVQVPGHCCPICVSTGCEVDGTIIQEGESADVTLCKHCTCSNGEAICAHQDCIVHGACAHWEHHDDQCCPVCVQQALPIDLPILSKRQALPGSGTSCEVSGVTIQEGEFVDVTPCQHCGCFNGQPICAVVDCFWSPSCAQWAYPAGQCCPVCVQDGHPWVSPVASKRETPARACVVDGVTIEEGEYQQTDEYGCTECGCTGGQPLCWSMACALDINCAEWERVPGRCCPVCTAYHQHHVDIPMLSKRTSPVRPTTCEVDGVTIAEGEFKPIDQNGCTTCGCSNGQSFCMAIGCALPANCAETEQIPGQCCPVCTSYATCEVNGVTIQEGESKPTDQYGCETCTCVNGQPICQAIACALPANCAETERVPGQCCPVCTSFTTCEANGVTIPEGEWVPTDEYGCETCTCDNGMTLCQNIACAPLFNCAETERVPGQCCPVCKTYLQPIIQDLPLLLSKRQAIPFEGESCEVDGVTIPNGEFAHVTPCKPCTCFNGQAICTHVDCPWGWPPNCVQWEYPSDQCCPPSAKPTPVDCNRADCWWTPTCAECEGVPGQCCPICKQHMKHCDP
uniref:VWFC domain-containing protein n=1 Tax=Branchiostoma floridae TaxID=7739 RepID=C3ZHH5_BRAFL|eukprot:XP_002591959.1 hypothetical protein BRAFLDRAFT_79552 [Branchiostoma floridae]